MTAADVFGRPLRSLRLSVTDRCNIRCAYCMPDVDYVWLPRETLLSFEEMTRLTRVFTRVGVDRVRLTGGEPLLRRDLPGLVEQLAGIDGLRDLALTTNGILLAPIAETLARAGLHRITVSLDTLSPTRFEALTRFDRHAAVLDGIAAATAAFGTLKIDSVIMRGVNDDEVVDLVEFAKQHRAEVRFVEYMDVGGATRWSLDQVVTREEMLATLRGHYGSIEPIVEQTSAPAERFRLGDGTIVGIIASTTAPFCRSCDRARLTADGHWLLCLYAAIGIDLRGPLRAGASDDALEALIGRTWMGRRDRGAELRLEQTQRRAHPAGVADVHLQMHTRGG